MRRPSENGAIPDGWRRVPLKEVLELDQPGAWGDNPTAEESGVRVLRAADLTRDGRVNPANAAWRRLSGRDLERRLMRDGDLILERSGGGPGTPVGRVALIDGLGSVYCNNFCQQLRVDTTQCISKYAARALWYRYTQGITARLEHQTTGIRNLDYAAYLDLPILLPPLPEQRAIAAVLDSIDDAIEGAESVIAATEGLRDALLHDLLTRGVPGWHTEFRDVPGLGTIPADWQVVRLGDVAEVERGKFAHRPRNEPRFYGGDIPFIQTAEVVKATGKITEHSQTLNELGLSISKLFPVGTIVITIAANIGETGITSYPVAFPDSLVGITPNRIDTRFLEYFLRTRKAFLNELAPESAQKNINLEDLRPLLTPVPPLAEQQGISEMLNGTEAAVEVAVEELVGLRLLKESAADALLMGRVRTGGKNG